MQIARLTDGRRKVVSIQEITGMEGEIITMQEIFVFQQTGVADDGAVQGHFCATGVRPRFADRLRVVRHRAARSPVRSDPALRVRRAP